MLMVRMSPGQRYSSRGPLTTLVANGVEELAMVIDVLRKWKYPVAIPEPVNIAGCFIAHREYVYPPTYCIIIPGGFGVKGLSG